MEYHTRVTHTNGSELSREEVNESAKQFVERAELANGFFVESSYNCRTGRDDHMIAWENNQHARQFMMAHDTPESPYKVALKLRP